MKQVLFILCSVLLAAGAYAADPNEKVLKSFKETFANAEEVKWAEYDNYYTVSFVSGKVRAKVNYDKDGNMMGSTRYYEPNLLPIGILNAVKKAYPTKTLFGVTEITAEGVVNYYVKMEDAKHWTTIKVDDSGNTSVYEKYKKG
ncbi:hypothetical protein HHL16_02780 [Pseudoflavitalea sp. G-6-1-2]|uniref:hypothetical protein n=1 Tax=Pseudoflavitalea sp. G-6-1-2 TaxID=2728841 RepID=UPI00146BBE3D|nr:hypothetical protein [Pseudoflavitalea sp. G-6-1-2]NML19777.1 hypothetical protein [Pseudoflavitalea sp. G-6-1-2]